MKGLNFSKLNVWHLLIVIIVNAVAILFVYQSALFLELQGDTWQYAWGHQIYYGSNVFSPESLKGMRTSLGGASLTFGLIQNHFGLNPLVHYSIALFLKFLTVIAFYFLVKKITENFLASLIASVALSVSFAGIEAVHWVFNMYAYIGLLFIILSIFFGIDLPEKFQFKKWLLSFLFACIGVWYATMRTNGVIPLIIVWSFVKFITLKTKDSRLNLLFWILGFIVFILIDKFLLGQMETDYSRHYIIGQGISAFESQVSAYKYDFILSSVSNLGAIILPDITWYSLNFSKYFSFLGMSKLRTIIIPLFLIFIFLSASLSNIFTKDKKITNILKDANFILNLQMGFLWTLIVYLITKIGPQNFSSPEVLLFTLSGGYLLIFCLYFIVIKNTPKKLKDLFFLVILWSLVFLLLPLFQNGGPVFGTYHRYMATTAPGVPLFLAGLITLSFLTKNLSFKIMVFTLIGVIIFNHGLQTKTFFDRKAQVHNRQTAAKVWDQFTKIVPNKPEFAKENPPILWFETADNSIDSQTLFETLYFGFLFKASIKYGWEPNAGTGLYYQNYNDLVNKIKTDPKLLAKFYGVRMENQSLIDVTQKMKQKLIVDIKL